MNKPITLIAAVVFLAAKLFSADPSWTLGRDSKGNLLVDAGVPIQGSDGTVVTFRADLQNAIRADFSSGIWTATSPDRYDCPADFLWYNGVVDGYGGKPEGSSCQTAGSCPNSNDIARISEGTRHLFIKNTIVKNSYITSADQHPDVIQSYLAPNHNGWLVFQDSEFRNGDVQIFQLGLGGTRDNYRCYDNRVAGLVLQNVTTGNTAAYITDCMARAGLGLPTMCTYPNMNVSCAWTPCPYVWIIASNLHRGLMFRTKSYNGFEKVIVVGMAEADAYTFIDGKGTSQTFRYDTIEDALAAGHPEPPFIRHSTAGWGNPANAMADDTAPAVTKITEGGSGTEITVWFDDVLGAASAANAVNYSVSGGVSVTGAKLGDNAQSVILTTTKMIDGVEYTVNISGVTDNSPQANTMTPAAKKITHTARYAVKRIGIGARNYAYPDWEDGVPYATGGSDAAKLAGIDLTQAYNPAPWKLYEYHRHGESTFNFPSVPNGNYKVRLHFCDFWDLTGMRMNIALEGQMVETGLNVKTAAGGSFIAHIRDYDVTVADGNGLTCAFTGTDPTITNIEILAYGEDTGIDFPFASMRSEIDLNILRPGVYNALGMRVEDAVPAMLRGKTIIGSRSGLAAGVYYVYEKGAEGIKRVVVMR